MHLKTVNSRRRNIIKKKISLILTSMLILVGVIFVVGKVVNNKGCLPSDGVVPNEEVATKY